MNKMENWKNEVFDSGKASGRGRSLLAGKEQRGPAGSRLTGGNALPSGRNSGGPQALGFTGSKALRGWKT